MKHIRPLFAALLVVLALFATGIQYAGSGGLRPATDAATADPRRIEGVANLWRRWVEKHGPSEAVLTIGYRGQIVASEGHDADPGVAVPAASLSKAITAICTVALFRTQGLPLETTLGELSDKLSAIRVTPPAHARDLRVADFITHASGLRPDVTQGEEWGASFGTAGMHRRVAFLAINAAAMRGRRGDFFYNNGNYAMLGAVIEAVSGRSYGEVCQSLALDPAGVTTAHLGGTYAALSSFGGWDISVEDYARFVMHWFTPEKPWVERPQDYPFAERGPDGRYGLGLNRSETSRGPVLRHLGFICVANIRQQRSNGVILLPGSWTIVASWNRCIDEDMTSDFIESLALATR